LHGARRADRPPAIAQVVLELALDRRKRERGKRQPAPGIEAVDRLDEPDRGDPLEILDVLDIAISPRKLARQRHELLHDGVSRGRAAIVSEPREQSSLAGVVGPIPTVVLGDPPALGHGRHHCNPRINLRRNTRGPPKPLAGRIRSQTALPANPDRAAPCPQRESTPAKKSTVNKRSGHRALQ
jgi:hypothetical protein